MDALSSAQLRAFSFSSPQYVDAPYDYCRTFLRHHPVFHSEADDCYVVSRFDAVKHILSDYETFSSDSGVLQKRVDRPDDYGFAPIFMMAPPAQTRLRKLAAPAFSASFAQEIEADVGREAQRLLRQHAACPVIEVVDDYATPLVVRALVQLLGVQGDLGRQLASLIAAVTTGFDNTQHEDTSFIHADDKSLALKKIISAHYSSVKPSGECRFVAKMTTADRDGDRLSDNEAYGLLYLSSVAGAEDAIRSIANVLVALSENETVKATVCNDIDGMISDAILESIRLYPSSHFVRRTATRDVVIDGMTLPTGSNVIAHIAAANRDGAQFKDPDIFRLGRGNVKSAMTFGAGPHVCIGKHLGRIIVTAAVAGFLKTYPNYRLDLTTADKTGRGMILGYRKLVTFKERQPTAVVA